MDAAALTTVFHGIVLSLLTYCASAWQANITSAQVDIINAFFRKAHRWNCCSKLFNWETLVESIDNKLFRRIQGNAAHCLRNFLPRQVGHKYGLRRKNKNKYELPQVATTLCKNSFINRNIFKNRY